jgi:pimeloyl-ACP methyl ester carboxylesterase
MAPRRRIGKKLLKSLLPIIVLLALAVVIVSAALVYGVVHPPRRAYLVTPDAFRQISGPVLKVTDEVWTNPDGTSARGWLLRGAEGAPAVVFLHRYGADRSWLFNLGVKLNETAGFTILWPDLRGHGMTPPVSSTTFGARESDDVIGALHFLRRQKTPNGSRLVGNKLGLYGVELGGYAALRAAPQDPEVTAIVLDSVSRGPDELLRAAVRQDYEIDNNLLQFLARMGTRIYLMGKYSSTTSCELAARLQTQKVLLLSGEDADYLRESTSALASCFPNPANLEVKTDLPLTGFHLASATGEQGEGYDRRVIDFFYRTLR